MDSGDRANELYWGSDHSVNQIADELDLSKGALYEMIRPLSAGFGCPLCGTEVVHPNRTAKDRGRVECSACGWDGTGEEALSLDAGSESPLSAGNGSGVVEGPAADLDAQDDMYPYNDFDTPGPPPVPVTGRDIETRRLVAGGALLGAAVGLALVIWARRR